MPGTDAARLERDIVTVRDEQRCLEHQLEDAIQSEIRGMSMADGARANQSRCRRLIEERAQAICSLQDELRDLPEPRQP